MKHTVTVNGKTFSFESYLVEAAAIQEIAEKIWAKSFSFEDFRWKFLKEMARIDDEILAGVE